MMKLKILLGVLLTSTSLFAQDNYSKINDNPAEVIKGHVGVELYGVDVGFKNTSGAMIATIGATARYPISNKLMAEGLLRVPIIRFEKESFAFIADAGINYQLSSVDVSDDVKVILGYKETDNIGSETRTATTKYININGTVRKNLYARAGAYLRNSAFDDTSENTTDYSVTSIFHKGIYLGLARERQYYFQLQRNRNGEDVKFGAGIIFMFYADAMLLPVNVKLQQNTFGYGTGVSKELSGLLGGRIGFKFYRNPFTRSQNFNHKIPFFGNSFFTMEAGIRPLEGLFITGGFTYILHKF